LKIRPSTDSNKEATSMIEKKVVAILADVRINSIHGRESYSFAIYFALENKCLAQPPLLIPSSYMQYPVHTGVTVSAPGDKAKNNRDGHP